VPVDYRLFKRGDRWMIYDISTTTSAGGPGS
jgi:hypothetical protein